VLVTDAAGASTWGHVLDEVWEGRFASRYDQVFLLDFARERCGELRILAQVTGGQSP
jgi:hypothetical protein